MANIDPEIEKFRTAKYGEEVRGAMISAYQKINAESTAAAASIDSWLAANAAATIQQWMDAHPEATTTVEDGSLTSVKLSQENGLGIITPEMVQQEGMTDAQILAAAIFAALTYKCDLYLPKRVYELDDGIYVNQSGDLKIRSNGAVIRMLPGYGQGEGRVPDQYNFINADVAVDLTLEGITFEGCNSSTDSQSESVLYPDLIEVAASSGGGSITIRNCRFHKIRVAEYNTGNLRYDKRKGYLVTGIGLDRFTFEDNEVYDCGGEEIMIICPTKDGPAKTVIEFNRNYIHDVTGWSFNLLGHTINCEKNIIDGFVEKSTIFNFSCRAAHVRGNYVINSSCLDVFDFCEQGVLFGMDVVVADNYVSVDGGGLVRTHGEKAVIENNTVYGAWLALDYAAKTPIHAAALIPSALTANDWIQTESLTIKNNLFVYMRTSATSTYPHEHTVKVGYVADFIAPIDFMTAPVDYGPETDPTTLAKPDSAPVIYYADTFNTVLASDAKKQAIDDARKLIPPVKNLQIVGNTFDMSADSSEDQKYDRPNDEMFQIFECENVLIADNRIINPRSDQAYTSQHTLAYFLPYKDGFGTIRITGNSVTYRNDNRVRLLFYTVFPAYINANRPEIFASNFICTDNSWFTYLGERETVYFGILLANGQNKILNAKFTSDVRRVGGAEYGAGVGRAVKERPMQYGIVQTRDSAGRFEVDFAPPFVNKPIVVGTISDNRTAEETPSPPVAVRLINVYQDRDTGLYTYALFEPEFFDPTANSNRLTLNWMAVEPE